MITPASLAASLPPLVSGYGGIALTSIQALSILTNYSNEADASTRTPYSKFAVTKTKKESKSGASQQMMVPSKTGMTIIYTPALVVSCLVLLMGSPLMPPSLISIFSTILPNATPAAYLCAIHFCKRFLEINFLHVYSGSVSLALSSFIGTYYALVSFLICSVASESTSPLALSIGTCLFAIGLVGNWYHHKLLADLRVAGAKSASKGYVAPKGGLFHLVAAPHYLFELVGWLGMAVVANHGNAYLVFASMGAYLGGRAKAQHEWNRSMFPEEWDGDQKRWDIVPFVL